MALALLLVLGVFLFSPFADAACMAEAKPQGYRFPVVFRPPSALKGVPVNKVVAWTWSDQAKSWRQITIQVDERNSDGNYVLEDGQPYTRGTDDGLADDNDELIIRGRDLGDSFERDKISKEILATLKAYERLDVCSGGAYAGSILVGWSQQPWAAPSKSVVYSQQTQTINASAYRYEFNRTRPMLIGEVFLKSKGKEFPVFADSTFVMPLIPSFWILPGTTFDESDFTSEIECWRSGPIRSIVAVGVKMSKFFSLVKLHLFSELVFYEDYFQIPTKIEMIFDASRFLRYGSGLAYVLRYPQGGYWDVSTNFVELPKSRDLGGDDGHPKITASQVAKDGIFKAWGSRSEGSFLAQVHVEEAAMADVPPPFIIYQHMFDKEPWRSEWPWTGKTSGNLGVFLDISRVRKGVYDFTLDLMLSDQANDGFTDFRPISWDWLSLQ